MFEFIDNFEWEDMLFDGNSYDIDELKNNLLDNTTTIAKKIIGNYCKKDKEKYSWFFKNIDLL